MSLCQDIPEVVMDTVTRGIDSGHQTAVCRQRQRDLANHRFEADAILCQSVQVGCFDLAVSVATNVVSSQGVDADGHRTAGAV